jgi:DNA-binding transcriptional LysR family regulator
MGPVANRAMSRLPGRRLRAAAGGHRGEGPAVAGPRRARHGVVQAAQRGPSLADARDEPFVCLPADSRLQAILTGAAAAEGFVPRIEFETYSPASIRELVAAGLGVALLARSATERPGPAIGVCELARPPEHPPIGLIRSRARPLLPAARAFWDHLAATGGQADGAPRAAPGGR